MTFNYIDYNCNIHSFMQANIDDIKIACSSANLVLFIYLFISFYLFIYLFIYFFYFFKVGEGGGEPIAHTRYDVTVFVIRDPFL